MHECHRRLKHANCEPQECLAREKGCDLCLSARVAEDCVQSKNEPTYPAVKLKLGGLHERTIINELVYD